MIIQRIRGGLGNQLFQYYTAKAVALSKQTTLKLDFEQYNRQKDRQPELRYFQTSFDEITPEERAAFVGNTRWQRYLNRKTFHILNSKAFVQPHLHYAPNIWQVKDEIYLSGYWQSEQYFHSIRSLICEEMVPGKPLDQTNLAWIELMEQSESVAVHIRRGDYISNKSYAKSFVSLKQDYYSKAMGMVEERVSAPVFFFFSDDISWCREEFGHLKDAHFVGNNDGDHSYIDLYLMSKCNHNIIANSTFSWWSAWLNQHEEKIIIAPARRFSKKIMTGLFCPYPNRFYDEKDYLPDAWLKI